MHFFLGALRVNFRGIRKQRPKSDGNKDNIENREHEKTFFFKFGEQWSMYPPWPGKASAMQDTDPNITFCNF